MERKEEKLQDVLKAKKAFCSEANTNQKKTGVSLLISYKVNLKAKFIIPGKRGTI